MFLLFNMRHDVRILADKNIPCVYRLFGLHGQVQLCEGRMICNKDVKNIDVLIIRSITKIDRMLLYDSKVKFIGTTTAGVDHVDQDFLRKRNIKFVSAPGSNAISVVEYVFTALFWLAQRDHFFLKDKTVGIVGVGHVGNLLYHRLEKFGVRTLLYDPYVSRLGNVTNKNWQSLETLVSESDILTFHTPLTYTGAYPTWHMVNLDFLEAVPSHSILINTARGEIIDNAALLKVLQHGKKMSVVLDVWESEPNLSLSLLSYVDIGTAHIAGHTYDSKIRSVMKVYNMYCNYFHILNEVHLSCYLLPVNDFTNTVVHLKKIDEFYLNQLIRFIYDIHIDHIELKNYVLKLGGFDLLRNKYCSRREWSAYLVSTIKDSDNEVLMNLGFNII